MERIVAATDPSLAAQGVGDGVRVVAAGGGALNRALLSALSAACAQPVATTADWGVPAAYREAAAMAVLGALCADRVSITLPHVTGRRDDAAPLVAGVWMLP